MQTVVLILLVSLSWTPAAMAKQSKTESCASAASEVIAYRLAAGEQIPSERDWNAAAPVSFCSDWQDEHPDPERATEVRLVWSTDTLYVRFVARYRELYTYPPSNMRVDRLWERDVAEVFIQPTSTMPHRYKEFEISPNGNWIDLDIAPGTGEDLHCPLTATASVDARQKLWIGKLSIPMQCLTSHFDPQSIWRVNFFRVEGREPQRFYSAWHPTHTPKPNFHVPEVFGVLRFQ
jgi:Carbohydrate-binding family 9